MKEKVNIGLISRICVGLLIFAALMAVLSRSQTVGDDLAQALANHGMDPKMAPAVATVLEIAISNDKDTVKRITALEQQMNAVNVKLGLNAQFMLAYSLSASDTSGLALDGATIRGSVAVFTAIGGNPGIPAPQGSVLQVNYTIDGKPWPNVEKQTTFDFNGGALWNTALPVSGIYSGANGVHVITQTITKSDGTSPETDTATFTVAN